MGSWVKVTVLSTGVSASCVCAGDWALGSWFAGVTTLSSNAPAFHSATSSAPNSAQAAMPMISSELKDGLGAGRGKLAAGRASAGSCCWVWTDGRAWDGGGTAGRGITV